MSQIIDNLNDKVNQIPYGNGINVSSAKTSNVQNTSSKDVDELLGYKFSRGSKKDNYLENTTMKNFQEYIQNRQEKAKEAGLDSASEEAKEKENEKEVTRNLTSEEIKRLKLMGVDVEGASMSDLLGMVNTMRHNEHKDELSAMMAEIAFSEGDTSGMTVIGGTTKVGGVEVDIDVSSVSEARTEQKTDDAVTDKKPEPDKPVETAKNPAVENTDETTNQNEEKKSNGNKNINADNFTLDNKEILYLLHNEMSVNESSLYKAHYSGTIVSDNNISDKEFSEMRPQIEKIIEQAGYESDNEHKDDAKLIINNDIPVTTDNIRKYEDLKSFIGQEISEIKIEDFDIDIYSAARKFMSDVEKVSPELVYDMAKDGREVTIASAVNNLENYDIDISDKKDIAQSAQSEQRNIGSEYAELRSTIDENAPDAKSITARRQMEEIRLSMTMEVAVRMTSLDVNVDTRELSKVVNLLRDVERELLRNAFKNTGVEPSDNNLLTYNEIVNKVNDIADAPAKILGTPLMNGGVFSINSLHISAVSESVSITSEVDDTGAALTSVSYEKVVKSYEAVGTAPRYDMGDSISKAFNNVDDILESMALPVNNDTQRAVRILGYNQLEITENNITEVMNYDRQVNEFISNLYPEAVLGLIKDNINPLDASIEDLNKTIRNKRYNEGVSEAEDFASYLRDMESKGEVSIEERESYIGIYRLMNKLAKSGDREAGWLFANSSRLTVRNLLSAMRSRKGMGIDVSVDDDFGMLDELNRLGTRIDEQIESAFNSEPDMASDSSDDIEQDIARFNELNQNVEEFIRENNIEYSMINAFAVDTMLNTPGGIYQMVSDIMAGLKFNTNFKDDAIDEESERMTDSMTGEEISVNPADFSQESILESLRGSEEMSLKYEDLRNQITEMMYQFSALGELTGKDIASIKTINAGFNIMSRMARNSRYQIPVETRDGINVINLSIEHNIERRGTIDINMSDERFGNISTEIRVGANGNMYGHIISDTSDGNRLLNSVQIMTRFKSNLGGSGYNTDNVTFGTVSTAYMGEYSVADERMLYEAAVALVQSIVGISG
ncbi:MAG: hypothetical protein IJV15_12330 [Lachnospiraceae bacterium]|nr:hypothetical protein [Lachnospiraceae bacterium]